MKKSLSSTSRDGIHKEPRLSSSSPTFLGEGGKMKKRCLGFPSTSDQTEHKKQRLSSSSICSHNIVLPDDLVFEILLRLPVTSLIKFRLVCRNWRLRLTDPSFMEVHNHRSPMSSVVVFPWHLTNSTLLHLHRFDHHCGINTVQITIPRDETGCFVNPTLKYVGSFDAMVCVAKTHDYDYFYVFNLLTKERMIVPSHGTLPGFYHCITISRPESTGC